MIFILLSNSYRIYIVFHCVEVVLARYWCLKIRKRCEFCHFSVFPDLKPLKNQKKKKRFPVPIFTCFLNIPKTLAWVVKGWMLLITLKIFKMVCSGPLYWLFSGFQVVIEKGWIKCFIWFKLLVFLVEYNKTALWCLLEKMIWNN